VERWIFPGDLLLENRQLELDQRKWLPLCRKSSGSSHGSMTPGPSFRAPQATAAYKYAINSPERGLKGK